MADPSVDIQKLFEPGYEETLSTYLRLLHPADTAALFHHVERELWGRIISLLDAEALAEVLSHLDEGLIDILGPQLKVERLAAAVEELETDDAADVLGELPREQMDAVLAELAAEDRDEIETLLAYDPETAGGLMQTELCRVQEDLLVGDAIESVRLVRGEDDDIDIHQIYLVDSQGVLKGTVQLADLVLSSRETALGKISEGIEQKVTAHIDQEEVAHLFEKYDMAALPVVNELGVLLGRITFDDIHDVLLEEATEDVVKMAGGSSEDLVYGNDFFRIALFRLPWLISSLLGSLLTTQLVPMFSDVPGDTILLAAFVPVVMAMTGNVGSQTAMIITRGLAIGLVAVEVLGRTVVRELFVGCLMGVAAGLLVGLFSLWRYDQAVLGLALTLSMISSMTSAACVGALAPVLFKRIGIDPAIAAGPLVTTTCDVLGVGIYLAVALVVIT